MYCEHMMTLKQSSDAYKGWYNIHQDSTKSMAFKRSRTDSSDLLDRKILAAESGDENPVSDSVAYSLAPLRVNVCCFASPHVVLLSRRLLKRFVLFYKIQKKFKMPNVCIYFV